MQTVFYERLIVLLFALRKRDDPVGNNAQTQTLDEMSNNWHGHLHKMIIERKKGPEPKTTRQWIAPKAEQRHEPRGSHHWQLIISSLKTFVVKWSAETGIPLSPEEAELFVGSFQNEQWLEIAKRLGVSGKEIRYIFP